MQPRSSLNRELLIPVVISIVSILGICWILFSSRRGEAAPPPTATPSIILSLEAATLRPSPALSSTQEEASPSATATSPEAYPGPPTKTLPPTSTFTATLPPPSTTPTPEGIRPLRSGKYDDTNPNIAYDPSWTALKNSSTAISYKGTIHASNAIGNEASFRFTGKRFSLGYQRGRGFGTVTVLVDDQPYSFHEQAFDLVWRSPPLTPGDHFVRIIHESGQSINLDYIQIVE